MGPGLSHGGCGLSRRLSSVLRETVLLWSCEPIAESLLRITQTDS